MHEQANLQVVHQAYAAFGKGDVPGVLAILTEDVRWSTPGPPDVIPYAGLRTGHEQVAGYFDRAGGHGRRAGALRPARQEHGQCSRDRLGTRLHVQRPKDRRVPRLRGQRRYCRGFHHQALRTNAAGPREKGRGGQGGGEGSLRAVGNKHQGLVYFANE
jgi:hypothetical protein